ncbi:MAG TPA: hypothetical protein VIW22_00120 [Nitrososphaerales archaeon]
MKVDAFFSDYDGTIAPLGVPRAESKIFEGVEVQLKKIGRQVPLCIVTSKDFDFVYPRCNFAAGWACVSGLDIKLADGRRFAERRLADLTKPLEFAKSMESEGALTELKRGPSGELLGLSIDWTEVPELRDGIVENLRTMSGEGIISTYDGASQFADFYAASPDKGKALKELKRLLGVQGNTMFIGDSPADNRAFKQAEFAIGVFHGQALDELRCEFMVNQARLEEFLQSLSDQRMDFTPGLPGVGPRGA